MKKHNEDLWDFHSDPVFDNNKKENTKSKTPDTSPAQSLNEDTNQNSPTEVFIDISSENSDDSLDNTTLIFTNGKPSFVTTPPKKAAEPVKKQEPEVARQKEAELKPVENSISSKKETEPAVPVAKPIAKTPAEPVAEESTAEEPAKSVAEEILTDSKEDPAVTTESMVQGFDPAIESEPTSREAEVKEESINNTITDNKNETEKAQFADIDILGAPVKSDNDKKSEVNPTQPEPEENINKAEADDIAESPEQEPQSLTDTVDIKDASNNTSAKKKVPATDNDFILAKPRSKKKRSHSHSSAHSHSTSFSSEKSELPDDNVDDYIYARYRRQTSKKHHHHKSASADYTHTPDNKATPVVRSTTAPHFRSKKTKKSRKWKRRPWWQKLLIILAWVFGIIIFLALAALIFFLISSRIGLRAATNYDNVSIEAPSFEGVDVSLQDDGKIIYYKGQKYKLNTDIANILCIGVDKQDINSTESETLADVGQADALFMIAHNTATGKTTVISVPRDTMEYIDIYNNGNYLGTEKRQICQSYAYGDGKESSCQNTISAVRRLFYQIPVQTYFAMDISAIAPINDAIGGVKVQMIDDSFYDINMIHRQKGDVIMLYGDNARKYLQQREVKDDASSIDRLQRQIQYLKSFSKRALAQTKRDITTPISLYNVISSNSVNNLGINRISGFASCIIDNGITDLEFKTVPGNSVKSETVDAEGEHYNEYHVDEEKFYELWLETYYVPVD